MPPFFSGDNTMAMDIRGVMTNADTATASAFSTRFKSDSDFREWLEAQIGAGVCVTIVQITFV
jgi:hypothetical protein